MIDGSEIGRAFEGMAKAFVAAVVFALIVVALVGYLLGYGVARMTGDPTGPVMTVPTK